MANAIRMMCLIVNSLSSTAFAVDDFLECCLLPNFPSPLLDALLEINDADLQADWFYSFPDNPG